MYLIKFAFRNMKSNKKIYMPYIVASIVSVLIFFVITFIGLNQSVLDSIQSETFEKILKVGIGFSVLAVFCFMYLANSYLIRNKKVFFGVCNTLGMSKNQIVTVTFWENIMIYITALVIGLVFGTGIAYGLSFGIIRLLNAEGNIHVELSSQIPVITGIVFAIIYLLLFAMNATMIYKTKTVELIKGKQTGDNEVKGEKLRSILGIIALIVGYGICLLTRSPLSAFVMIIFAGALIVFGIYWIFEFSSVKILKRLKQNEKVYYKTDNLICVSNLLYRIKKNAIGLATICVLGTAVIVIMSTTISLYAGIRKQVDGLFVKDVSISVVQMNGDERNKFDSYMKKTLKENNIAADHQYRHTSYSSDSKFVDNKLECVSSANILSSDYAYVTFVDVDDYNEVMNTNVKLDSDEVVVITNKKKFRYDTFILGNTEYKVKDIKTPDSSIEGNGEQITTCFEILLADKKTGYKDAFGANEGDAELDIQDVKYDLEVEDIELQNKLVSEIGGYIYEQGFLGSCSGYEETYSFYLSFYAGVLFIGIGLSILFIIMTGYIIYYKQISDSFEDRDKFVTMEKIGLTRKEIKKSAKKQMIVTFAAPVIFSTINVMFVSKIVYKLLIVLNMSNLTLFVMSAAISILIYAIIYIALYLITTQIYTRNVSEKYNGM